jgi:hypothetical protein
MGNKSKQRNKPGKWSSVKDTNQARQFKRGPVWFGLMSPRVAHTVNAVGIPATDTERAHPLRQRHAPAVLRRVA